MVSKKFTRVMSGIMAFLMVLSILPVSVFATETDAKETAETMDVTVTIVTADSEKKAIQGASVSIKDGETSETDESGIATLKALSVGTSYELTVKHQDYASVTQTLACNAESKAVTIALSALTDVTITVTDETGAVSGAVVSIEGVEDLVTTDEDGKAVFEDLTVGTTYTATVVCEGYVDSSKAFTGGETSVSVMLEKSKHDIALVVADGNGNAISGASVKVSNEERGTTSDEGKVVLEDLIYGETYVAAVECTGYELIEQEFVCNTDTIEKGVSVSLENRKLDITLTVTDDKGNAVSGVNVKIAGEDRGVTDNEGKVILEDLIYGQSYAIAVSCEGYAPGSVEFVCNDDNTAVSVPLTAYTKITISGTVMCEETPVSDALVTLNFKEGEAKTATPDANGVFSFVDVYKELVKDITVTGERYQDFVLTEVDKDNDNNNQISIDRKVFKIIANVFVNEGNGVDAGTVEVSAPEVKYGDEATLIIKSAETDGQSTHSIYYITDNGEIVAEDASGETNYEYKIGSVTKDHTVNVIFSKDTEVITFWVGSDGKVYVQKDDSEEYTEIEPWRIGNLKIEKNPVTDEETGDEKTELKVAYIPSKNYRVSSVAIDEAKPTPFSENDQAHLETEAFVLDEDVKRKYIIKVQSNQFTVSLAEEAAAAIAMDPENGVVNYNRDLTLTITPPEGKYLSELTVNEEPAFPVSYDWSLPVKTLEKIRENKTVSAVFSDILENEAGKAALAIIPAAGVFRKEAEGHDTYYLPANTSIHIQAANSGVKISRNPNGPFGVGIDISTDDAINVLYLLEGTTITKVTHSIQTVVDTTAPMISGEEFAEVKDANNKTTGVTWTITAVDNDGGSGINRVVYMKDPDPDDGQDFELADDAVKALETVTDDNGDGTYSHTFNDARGTYYFWAIDNLGHVSEISDGCYVDSDTGAPEIVSFEANGFRSFVLQKDGVDTVRHYPVEDGVTFTVQVADTLSGIETVVLHIGDTFTKAMERTETKDEYVEFAVMVTPAEFNSAMETDENQELEVTVVATDDSINKNVNVPYELDKKLIFEEKIPSIAAVIPPSVKVNNVNWYQRVDSIDATITLTVEDTGAGLNTKTIRIWNNDTEIFPSSSVQMSKFVTCSVLYTDENGKEWSAVPETQKAAKAVFTIRAEGEADKITEFDFKISVKDNEGNEAVYGSEQNLDLKFSVDGVKPVVEKFDLVPNPEDKNSVEYDATKEDTYSDQENTDVEATDYGYFFRRAAKVKVYVSDEGSQVKTISFYAIAHDAELVDGVTQKLFAADKTPEGFEKDRWYAEFDVAEGFKGQIYAYATDNVKNSNQAATAGQDAHPENLTITESQNSHNKYDENPDTKHVVLEIPETALTDEAGTPLYSMIVYKYDENGKVALDEKGNPIVDKEKSAYSDGVPVEITVRDLYNGIQTVKYSITHTAEGAGKPEMIMAGTLNSANFKDNQLTDSNGILWTADKTEKNLITEITATIKVTKNSNDIVVSTDMTDMANNISMDDVHLSIDNTAPSVEFSHLPVAKVKGTTDMPTDGKVMSKLGDTPYFVGFNTDGDKLSEEYPIYDRSTLQIKITERNLGNDKDALIENKMLVQEALKILTTEKIETVDVKDITKDLKFYGPFVDDPQRGRVASVYPYSDETYYLIELKDCGEEDKGGTYETDFAVKDLAGHGAAGKEFFVIDETAPAITITFDNNSVRNGKYYKADRTATITVVERNFNNESGEIDGTASDDGTGVDFPMLSGWTDSEDYMTHTATVSFTTDALYQDFAASYVDLAGRDAEATVAEFYVDKTMPVIFITGVLDKSANNGTVAPYITYTDTNIDLTSAVITLTGANNGVAEYDAVKEAIEHGEKYVYYDFDHEKEVDDVYTLYVRAVDMAGNTVTETIRFSCNRFGSVFDLSSIADMLGKYNQRERTIVVTETNVDELDLNAVRVTLTKNGNPADLVMGKDFTIEMVGGEGTWHQYTYKILSNLFKDDGTYSLYFYTEDVAGNINENIDESKEAQISFGIDKTKPIATPIDFESDTQYALESKTVSIEIKDNLLLEGVKIYLNDKEITYVVDGDNYIFDIPMSNTKQTVRIVAVDAAGNEEEIFVKDFLVTTNFFVRWYNNTPLFIGSMVLLALILIVLAWRIIVVILKKRNNDEEEI